MRSLLYLYFVVGLCSGRALVVGLALARTSFLPHGVPHEASSTSSHSPPRLLFLAAAATAAAATTTTNLNPHGDHRRVVQSHNDHHDPTGAPDAFGGIPQEQQDMDRPAAAAAAAAAAVTTAAAVEYAISYSVNFRRHVVRQRRGGGVFGESEEVVVESFLWFDQAQQSYPTASYRPVILPCKWVATETLGAAALFAGTSASEASHYPIAMESVRNRRKEMQQFLQSQLKWFPQQIERFLNVSLAADGQTVSTCYSAEALAERIRFLLAPLPHTTHPVWKCYSDRHSFREFVLSNERVDWPRLFYREGCGAGMTVAQVSHALQTIPAEILVVPFGHNDDRPTIQNVTQLAFLYDQTPPLVADMTRQQLDPSLSGVTNQCVFALAYLHWKGWEWGTCRIVMDALHCFSTPLSEEAWGARTTIKSASKSSAALPYLQKRLQLQPWQIRAMLRTHPSIGRYTISLVQTSIDQSLGRSLQLTSAEIQRLVLQMPSLLGTSRDSVLERLAFWTNRVGLNLEQLRGLVLGPALKRPSRQVQPIFLTSSLVSLRAKLYFFADVLHITPSTIIDWTIHHPDLWSRSLDHHYRPLTSHFCQRCQLTEAELGQIVLSRAPQLLKCHWEGNLRIKLDFLQRRLGVSDGQLRTVVLTTPTILMYSIANLESKLNLLMDLSPKVHQRILVNNPSLLLNSPETLEKRVLGAMAQNRSLVQALGGFAGTKVIEAKNGSRSRRTRSVWLISSNESNTKPFPVDPKTVIQEFPSVLAAAEHAGISRSNMYLLLRKQSPTRDRMWYVYADDTFPSLEIDRHPKGNSMLDLSSRTSPLLVESSPLPSLNQFIVCTTGRAFPPEYTIRGHRRGGGMALFIPSFSSEDWKAVAVRLWKGQDSRIRLLKTGCLVLGYPYTRPSRGRCSLYVVREALRVAREAAAASTTEPAEVVVVTDSPYVLDLLQNSSSILDWAVAGSAATIPYEGPLKKYQANPDILYPLAQTYLRLRKANVDVRFASSMEYPHFNFESFVHGARLAAKHMFELV